MTINKHAQALGRLSGAKKTKKQMSEMAKKRWAGWNESKAQREKEARESARKAFKKLM